MNRILLIIAIIISFTFSAYSEWEPFNNGIEKQSPSLNFVKYFGDQLYACTVDDFGAGQGLFSSTDFGASWKLIGLENVEIISLEKINNQLIVGTKYHGMYYSSNDGKNWEQRNTGLPEGNKTCINFLTNIGDTLLISAPDLYYSTDFGKTWIAKTISIQGVTNLTITYLESAANSIMIGGISGDIWSPNCISTDFGASWTETPFFSNHEIDNVSSFISYKNKLFFTNFESKVYSSSDNGKNWISKELPTENIVSIGVKNDSLCAVGSNGNIYVSLDEGNTYEFLLLSHLGPTNTLNRAAIGKRIIGLREGSDFFYYFDNYWLFNSIDVKVIGEIRNINRFLGNAIIKTDKEIYTFPMNGTKWDKFTKRPNYAGDPDSNINSITTIDDSKIVLQHNYAYSIAEDNGLTWERTDFSQNFRLFDLKFYSNIYLAISYAKGILYSLDKGKTWQLLPNTPLSNFDNHAFFLNDKIYCYSEYKGLYSTSDFGNTWIGMNNGLESWASDVYIRCPEICDNSLFLIVRKYYPYPMETWTTEVARSDNFGLSYKTLNTDFIPSSIFSIQDKLFVSAETYGLYYTSDKGETWIDISKGLENIKVLGIINLGEYLYISTNKGVYRDKLTEFGLGVKDNQIAEESLISPNPASDYINVDMSFLRMQESAIQIFNIFGECVLSVETGLRPVSTRIDISALPAGVYFVRIGGRVEKFLVVR